MSLTLPNLLIVALGGAFGAVSRFALSALAHRLLDPKMEKPFPVGTLTVNTIGCLAIGVVMYLVLQREIIDDRTRLLIVTGFLGSLTTFSAFGYETFDMLSKGRWLAAGIYVVLCFITGFLAVGAGWKLMGMFSPAN